MHWFDPMFDVAIGWFDPMFDVAIGWFDPMFDCSSIGKRQKS